jgi:hypothetical protein
VRLLLIAFIAAMLCACDSRRKPVMMNVENAKYTPAVMPAPTAAARVKPRA